ncbi:hypothetical protein M758_8G062400 [Ceratodon purpureus]|nr:hypothetical protein M758_8G062400 [Ceratodon purpureus]
MVLATHNVKVLGSGSRVVVLGHGFGTDQSCFQHIVPTLLQKDLRVILYDVMGAGSTNTDGFNFKRYSTHHAHADDLLAILDELEIQSCVYVGHSMSGMVGCTASIERPEVFEKLILLGASPRYLNDESYVGGFEQQDLDQVYDSMRADFQAWVSAFAPLAVGADVNSRAVQEFRRTLSKTKPEVAVHILQAVFQSDLRSILPQVTVPCHVVQSIKDITVPVQVAEYFRKHLGGSTTVELLQTEGHLPQLSAPETVVPMLLRCIDQ